MYQGNPSHTGGMNVSLDPSKFGLYWSKNLGTLELNPVTIANGSVFVSQTGYFNIKYFYALDSSSGNEIWSLNFGDIFSLNPPSYSDGKVYIQTGDSYDNTYLRAYYAETGMLVFKSSHSAQWEAYYSPTIYKGKVYIDGGAYGGMYAFDGTNGHQDWFYGLPQYDLWTPAVDENWAYSYVGEYSPGLYVVDRLTGKLVFQIPDPGFAWDGWSMNLAPVLGGLSDVFAIHNGRLIRFDLNTRSIDWVNDENFTGQPTVVNGVVYAISSGALGVYDQKTGIRQWMWEAPGGGTLQDTIILTDSHAFVRTATDTYCIDLAMRNNVWSYPAAGHLSLGEGTLYIAGSNGTLTAINLGIPDIYVPESVTYENTDLGDTLTKTLPIKNVGNEPLNIASVTSS